MQYFTKMITQPPAQTKLPSAAITWDKVNSNSASSQTNTANDNDTAFPVALYTLLERASLDAFDHVIAWEPNGKSFLVLKPNLFAKEVMARCVSLTL